MLSSLLVVSLLFTGETPREEIVTGYTRGESHELILLPIVNGGRLESCAARAFLFMHAAAAKDGIELKVNSSYRDYREQKKQRREKGRLAAKPGYSKHQSGLAVDIANTRRKIAGKYHKTIVYWWLKRNASRFGFYQTVKSESWHWEYKETPE